MPREMNDGGPAFSHDSNCAHSDGISLRDWFAAQALYAAVQLKMPLSERDDPIKETAEAIAKAAYLLADAMLKVRKG